MTQVIETLSLPDYTIFILGQGAMKNAIQIRTLDHPGAGYRLLASWKRPKGKVKKSVDAWVPALAPSHALRRRYDCGIISWPEFATSYLKELRSPSAQDFLKPLALLSLRRKVVFLCDCAKPGPCPTRILTRVFMECRRRRDFSLVPPAQREKVSCRTGGKHP